MSYKPNPLKQIFHSTRRIAAKSWLCLMPVTQIAITGSQGKTNTSSTLFQILSAVAPTIRTDLNLDTVYNVPITALKIRPWSRFAIFELGVDQKGEMDLHLGIVRPKIAIVTGISPVHTDAQHLGSFENLIKEKQKLVQALPRDGWAILNGDDPYVRSMAKHSQAKVVFYGQGGDNDIQASDIELSLQGISFRLKDKRFEPNPPHRLITVQSSLIGKHHINNIMASYAVYRILGYENTEKFLSSLSQLAPLPGRMSVEKGPIGTTLINDSLRANPSSTASGLETLSLIKTEGKKIAILAEMGELEKPNQEHAKIGKLIARLDIDSVVLIGDLHKNTLMEAVKHGYPKDHILFADDAVQAGILLKKFIHAGDVLYVKGSLLRHVERVLMVLNGEKVICKAKVCPFYHHCPQCKYLFTGY